MTAIGPSIAYNPLHIDDQRDIRANDPFLAFSDFFANSNEPRVENNIHSHSQRTGSFFDVSDDDFLLMANSTVQHGYGIQRDVPINLPTPPRSGEQYAPPRAPLTPTQALPPVSAAPFAQLNATQPIRLAVPTPIADSTGLPIQSPAPDVVAQLPVAVAVEVQSPPVVYRASVTVAAASPAPSPSIGSWSTWSLGSRNQSSTPTATAVIANVSALGNMTSIPMADAALYPSSHTSDANIPMAVAVAAPEPAEIATEITAPAAAIAAPVAAPTSANALSDVILPGTPATVLAAANSHPSFASSGAILSLTTQQESSPTTTFPALRSSPEHSTSDAIQQPTTLQTKKPVPPPKPKRIPPTVVASSAVPILTSSPSAAIPTHSSSASAAFNHSLPSFYTGTGTSTTTNPFAEDDVITSISPTDCNSTWSSLNVDVDVNGGQRRKSLNPFDDEGDNRMPSPSSSLHVSNAHGIGGIRPPRIHSPSSDVRSTTSTSTPLYQEALTQQTHEIGIPSVNTGTRFAVCQEMRR